jgi:hypothetical protein
MRAFEGLTSASKGWGGRLLLLAALVGGGCGPTTGAGASSPVAQVPSAAPSSAVAASASAHASVPAPTPTTSIAASAAPSGVPILDPEHCPATLPAGLYQTADGTKIDGDGDFITHVERALAVLKETAPALYADVLVNVVTIRQVESFSGMCYDTGTYRVGEETAHAPGHGIERQLVWLAGTIVHDGCHRARFVEGMPPSGRDAELACLTLQVEALDRMQDDYLRDYVQGLIDTVDDPASQYWTNPDRHW